MEQPDKPRSISEIYGYSAAWVDLDLAEAERRYDGLLERRSKSAERYATGAAIVNATSLTAVFSAVQGGQEALKQLGITQSSIASALGLFVLGIISAAVAHWWESIRIPGRAAYQYERLLIMRRQKAIMSSKPKPSLEKDFGETLEELKKKPPGDFWYSRAHMYLSNFSGSCWLVGVSYLSWPLWKTQLNELTWIDWLWT